MKFHTEEVKRPIVSKTTLVKLGFSALFLFFIYIIWNATESLSQQLKTATNNSLAVHDLQVEYKNEVQEWKNLLLRSHNKELLDKNWQSFETNFQHVEDVAKKIRQNNDVARITDPLVAFSTMHVKNFEKYKAAKEVLFNSSFQSHQADALVVGIDRPLSDQLEKSAEAMQEEQNNINDRIAGKMTGQIEQYLLVLALISLLLVWMPKW
jgi:hypothetical protein